MYVRTNVCIRCGTDDLLVMYTTVAKQMWKLALVSTYPLLSSKDIAETAETTMKYIKFCETRSHVTDWWQNL